LALERSRTGRAPPLQGKRITIGYCEVDASFKILLFVALPVEEAYWGESPGRQRISVVSHNFVAMESHILIHEISNLMGVRVRCVLSPIVCGHSSKDDFLFES
jgi:hypothetical protein